jgi:hypothetical protein
MKPDADAAPFLGTVPGGVAQRKEEDDSLQQIYQ